MPPWIVNFTLSNHSKPSFNYLNHFKPLFDQVVFHPFRSFVYSFWVIFHSFQASISSFQELFILSNQSFTHFELLFPWPKSHSSILSNFLPILSACSSTPIIHFFQSNHLFPQSDYLTPHSNHSSLLSNSPFTHSESPKAVGQTFPVVGRIFPVVGWIFPIVERIYPAKGKIFPSTTKSWQKRRRKDLASRSDRQNQSHHILQSNPNLSFGPSAFCQAHSFIIWIVSIHHPQASLGYTSLIIFLIQIFWTLFETIIQIDLGV